MAMPLLGSARLRVGRLRLSPGHDFVTGCKKLGQIVPGASVNETLRSTLSGTGPGLSVPVWEGTATNENA